MTLSTILPLQPPTRHTTPRTLLVVDDDPSLRRVLEKILTRTGYHVLTADDARTAVLVARAHDGPIHGAVADLLLPDRGGWEMATELREIRPGLPVLFMSGYDRAHAVDRELIPPREALTVDLLQKPFAAGDLTTRISALLEESAEDG